MRILIAHRDLGSRKLVGALAALAPELEMVESLPGEEVGPLEGVDAILAVGRIDREVMERGRFGFIQTVGTGYDNIDLEAATELGIAVSNMPASQTGNAESVAEHAILLMLALSRQLRQAEAGLKEQHWAQPVGQALLRKRALLIGLGDVGTALAVRLSAFGMQLAATRRHPERGGPAYVQVLPAGELADALGAADYVILCARAGEDNRNLMDARALAAMKRGAILINVARGSLIDHDALLELLTSGHLRGAGLDVFWEEPVQPGHPLFALPNVIATPHIAGVTDVNLSQTFKLMTANLRRYARGEVPEYLVNQPAISRSPGFH